MFLDIYIGENVLKRWYWVRLGAVPIFPLEFVEPRNDIANAGARLDELKSKNRDCSQSSIGFTFVIFRSHKPTGSINTLCQLAATLADKN